MVPLDTAESVLDVEADESGGGAIGYGGTDFRNLVFGARWTSCAELVRSSCDLNLRLGRGGNNAEGELNEGLGTHDGPDCALVGILPERAGESTRP